MTSLDARILYVDDSEPNRDTLSALLEDAGFAVDVAGSLREASERIERARYDVFVLDQDLGDGLGSDLATKVRARFPEARVILLSGAVPPRERAPHADACLAKGTPFSELLLEIARR